IRTAANGREAIDYIAGAGIFEDRNIHPAPALILLDIKMPYADGFEVLAWVREAPERRGLPVLMLTGSCQPKDVRQAYALGANGFLVKPASLETFERMMIAVKQFWLEFNLTC